jgi:hypothetical protein
MFTRMEIEHEVDQGARQPGAGANQHGETGAGHTRGTLEVEDAERGTEIPMRLRREIE